MHDRSKKKSIARLEASAAAFSLDQQINKAGQTNGSFQL
jgi:hypothetical protein